MHQDCNQGYYPVWLQVFQHIRRHDCRSHSACRDWRNDIAQNVVLDAFFRQCLREANLRQLGCRIIALAEASKQTSSRSSVDYSSILLFPEVWPRSPCTFICPRDMDFHNQIPVIILHVLEAYVPEDTSIVDEDIDPAEALDGSLN